MLSEISQTEKDKYNMISLICEIKKRKRGLPDVEGVGVEWAKVIKKYKFEVIK